MAGDVLNDLTVMYFNMHRKKLMYECLVGDDITVGDEALGHIKYKLAMKHSTTYISPILNSPVFCLANSLFRSHFSAFFCSNEIDTALSIWASEQ